jgi:hypothetical protein
MNTLKRAALFVTVAITLSAPQAFGVVDQAITIQDTNLVLSWPSLGHESYLVQYRPTLDETTPWQNLTNAFPANSTNRTTYVIPCCTLVELAGTNLMSMMSGGSESMMMASSFFDPDAPELWAMPADGSGSPVPLAIYPPGVPTNHLVIFEASASEMALARKSSVSSVSTKSSLEEIDGGNYEAQGISNGGCDCPDMGFFRVFHIPDWGFNITNYTYEGAIFLPVDFKDYRDRVENVQVYLNNQPLDYAEFLTLDGTNWGVGVYFDRVTNGTYQIQLVTTIALNDEAGDGMISLALTNKAKNIVVFNEVTFPDWNDFMQGDTYTFTAKSTNPDTDWTIDIYDVNWQWVNSGSGHTSNGQISWTWDLNDWQNNNRDDFESDPYFNCEITLDSGQQLNGPQPQAAGTPKPMPTPVKGYPDRGDWVVSFQDRWYADAWGYPGDLQGKYEDAVTSIYGGPILVGDTPQWQPLYFGTNVYSQAQREATWSNLRAWLGDLHTRNFYYHGHGGATSLGCDRHTYTTNGLVTGGVFSYRGSKSTIQNWQIASISKYKRFRFVYLDGCNTASGDLPNAFNISKQTNDVAFYENHPKHPRPAVFVGWNQVVGGDASWGSAYKRHDFQAYWMGNWANDFDHPNIVIALDRANVGASWITAAKLWGALRVYGYQQMKIRDYNNKGDWRWP